MVQRFRTKIVEIEAVQTTGQNLEELVEWTEGNFRALLVPGAEENTVVTTYQVWDKLHTTWINVTPGQWIVRGAKNEFYPCDDETFHWKYEEV